MRGFAILGTLMVAACGDGEASRQPSGAESVTLLFAGDAMLAGEIPQALALHELTYGDLLAPVQSPIAGADLAFFNLESVVGASGEPLDKTFTFNAAPEASSALGEIGFDVASLANNHSLDYGAEGLTSTRESLHANAMDELGLVENEQPQKAVIRRIGEVSVGLLAYADPLSPYAYPPEFENFSPRPAAVETSTVTREVEDLAARVDVVVVSVHWGEEEAPITERQRELGHYLVEHGADVVVGHHPHVQQPNEWYGKGLILYSLGNFLFGLQSDPRHLESRLVRVVVDRVGARSAAELKVAVDEKSYVATPDPLGFLAIAR